MAYYRSKEHIPKAQSIRMERADNLPVLIAEQVVMANDAREFLNLPKSIVTFDLISTETDEISPDKKDDLEVDKFFYIVRPETGIGLLTHETPKMILPSYLIDLFDNLINLVAEERGKESFFSKNSSLQLIELKFLLISLFNNLKSSEYERFLSVLQKNPNKPFLIMYGHSTVNDHATVKKNLLWSLLKRIMGKKEKGIIGEKSEEGVEINRFLRQFVSENKYSAILLIACFLGKANIKPIPGTTIFTSPDYIDFKNNSGVVTIEK